MFIVIEGPDGCGKSTVSKSLAESYPDSVLVSDPRSTIVGKKILDIILENHTQGKTELLLFCAARVELVKTVIQPALDEEKLVISDRFSLSTFVYQSFLGLNPNIIRDMLVFSHCGVTPDYTFVLDVPYKVCDKRLTKRDKFEHRRFQALIHNSYKTIPDDFGAIHIDGNREVKDIVSEIRSYL